MQIVASEQQIQILLSGIFWSFSFFSGVFSIQGWLNLWLTEPSDREGQLYLILNKF